MKAPISWLKDFVAVDAPAEEIARRLTFSGTEVGGITVVGSEYRGVVVGEIQAIDPHPDADKLVVCRVNDGAAIRTVVCGARNFSVGDKAPLALPGNRLANGMDIQEARIRGVVSQGMLCAEDELGISDDHSGIMILSRDLAPGTPLSSVLGPPETVLEVEVTWNRPDCLSVIGIAREVAALFGLPLRIPEVSLPESDTWVEELADVVIEDPDLCPRYTGRVLTDVKLGPSPAWMQKRLALCGVRAINNVVDITNYVMLECGQPLHAFDHELLGGHKIIVRRVRPGERMNTLDNIERKITPEMLVIADAGRPVALAGVMGGAGSEIRENTVNVLLESACFHPPNIRSTSSSLGLSTESSYRFERGVDIMQVEWAGRRAAALMVEHAGATSTKGVIDVFPGKPAERTIVCRYQRVRDLTGVDIGDGQIMAILESLQLPVDSRDAAACTIRVPTFRPDLEIEADLIEEVARMHGLDKVPTVAPLSKIVPEVRDTAVQAVARCRSQLVGLGLTEIMNYSFLSQAFLDRFSPADTDRRVVLPNPVSADYAVMRDSLIPHMVDTLGRNLARETGTAAFFEMGKTYLRSPDGRVSEDDRLCIGLMGKVGRSALGLRKPVDNQEMFLWMKGMFEQLVRALHLPMPALQPAGDVYFEAGRAVSIGSGAEAIGMMGIIKESIRAEWRLVEPLAVAELRLSALVGRAFALPALKPAPMFPSVTRDLAMIVDESVSHDEVVQIIQRNAAAELTSVNLFDIFRSEAIGAGRKSLAYSLVYRSSDKTLTDEDANRFHESVKAKLKSELKAEIRDK